LLPSIPTPPRPSENHFVCSLTDRHLVEKYNHSNKKFQEIEQSLENLSDKGKKNVRTKIFSFKEKQRKNPKNYYIIFY
jgi:hypothetical protein